MYVQDDIKMYNYEVINSTLGSFNFFNKLELVQEMHEVPKGIEYDVRHRNQSDNALYDIITVRYKNTGSVSNILITNLCLKKFFFHMLALTYGTLISLNLIVK